MGSRDSLQLVVCLQQRRRCRLFELKAEVAALCAEIAITPIQGMSVSQPKTLGAGREGESASAR